MRRTAAYYRDVLGFDVVEHYEHEEPFAALYRDGIEILVVQARRGEIAPNLRRYGAGYDVYIDPDEVEGVDLLHAELAENGARILQPPTMTAYGSYEFVLEDVDGRRIGIGRIEDEEMFFGSRP